MDRQEFYLQLVNKLTELGIEQGIAQKHVRKIDKFFAGLSEEEIEKRIDDLGNADDFAKSMYEIIQDKSSAAVVKEAQTGNVDDKNDISENQTSLDFDKNDPSKADEIVFEEYDQNRNQNKDNVVLGSEEKVHDIEELDISVSRHSAISDLDDIFGKEISRDDIDNEIGNENSYGERVSNKAQLSSLYNDRLNDSFTDETLIMDSSAFKKVLSPEQEKRIKNNKILFWTSLVLTSPIWIFALLIVASILGCIFFAVGALTLACVVLMVGSAAAGTGTALFGIIYGITQLSVRPVGLYEIGLGIMIAGVTMIVGILLYNFIIRIMPIAYKYIIKFSRFVINKIKELFEYIKKECIGQ